MHNLGILLALAKFLLGVPKALLISADLFINHTMTAVSQAQAFSALQPGSFQKSPLKGDASLRVCYSAITSHQAGLCSLVGNAAPTHGMC